MPLTVPSTRSRFLILTALRWLPTGLLVPVLTLLPLERGLSLTAVGGAFAMQGLMVFALELPSGGLADAVGRRITLLTSSVFGLASLVLLLFADSFAELAVVFALQGVYRALDSGPLEAWYVDALLARQPNANIENGLSAAGVVTGASLAGGALLAGGLVAWNPDTGIDALALPIALALALQIVGVFAIAVFVAEANRTSSWRAVRDAVRDTPSFVMAGYRLVRGSRVLVALLSVELFWGFSMVTFEQLVPVRLRELLDDADAAAIVTGPAASFAWLAAAGGAALVPSIGRRLGSVAASAALFRVLQGLTVIGMGLASGVIGVLVAYLLCYTVHGASNPAHMTLLHREVVGQVRTTVLSLNSMVSQSAGAIGVLVLSAVADGTSVGTAMVIGGIVLMLAAALYLPAMQREGARSL